MSVVEMAAELGVARNTLETNWTAAHPEFLEAFTYAKLKSQAWWERQGRTNLLAPQGQSFNSSVWSRSMAARFPADWRESTKQEISGPNDGPIQTTSEVRWTVVDPSGSGAA